MPRSLWTLENWWAPEIHPGRVDILSIGENKRKSTTTDAEQGQSQRLGFFENMRTMEHESRLAEGGADKRVPAQTFPSFQEQKRYALFAHSLTLTSEKGHYNAESRYRFATHGRCAGGWLSFCSEVAMT